MVQQELVDRAVAAMKHFGAVSQTQARTLLTMWAHFGSLSRTDIEAVVRHFR